MYFKFVIIEKKKLELFFEILFKYIIIYSWNIKLTDTLSIKKMNIIQTLDPHYNTDYGVYSVISVVTE